MEDNSKEEKNKNIYSNYDGVVKLNKKRKNKILLIILLVILFISIVIFSVIFSFLNINNENIISGVSINGIDVSGLSMQNAKKRLENVFSEKINKEIKVIYGEYESTINPTLIEAKFNIDKSVEEAYKVGRSGNIITNNYSILFTIIGKKDIKTELTINEEDAKEIIKDISISLPGAIVENSYYIEDDNLIITKGKEGLTINEDKLMKLIYDELNNNISEGYIELPVTSKKPNDIDIQKIHDEIYKEKKNAYYTENPFKIYPEVEGIDFDVNVAKEQLKEEKDEYIIKLTITKPEITINKIGTEAFPDVLSTFTTKYDRTNINRTTNLQLAINKINGIVILPGDEFSYNKVVGERTIAAGYKEAKVYSNGEVVDGLGGGICQISSTLYNTALLANLEITSRRNHQFVTSYLPAGRDATVVYGSQDFKFKNNRTYPIKIEASLNSGIVRISLHGLKEEKEYSVTFETKTISAIPYKTKYIDDSSLEEGTEKVKQKGTNGLVTETYKILNYNGAVVSKTLLSKDTYNAMQKVVLRGTKKVKKPEENKDKNKDEKEEKDNNKDTETREDKDNEKEETKKEE